jgi:hypothetical protein
MRPLWSISLRLNNFHSASPVWLYVVTIGCDEFVTGRPAVTGGPGFVV